MISYQYLLWLLYGYIVVVYHKKIVIVCYSMTIQPLSEYHNLSLGIFSEPLAQVKIPKMPMAKRSRRCWTGKIGDTTTGP